MSNALVVAKNDKILNCLTEMVRSEGYSEIETAVSALEAKKHISDKSFDVVIIYTPLADELGLNLSIFIATHTDSGVFIAISKDTVAKTGDKLAVNGVVSLVKPLTAESVHHSLLAFMAMKCRMGIMEQENQKLKVQLEDIKVVSRAKCVLMQCLSMTEAQAHKYLEKQAMDMRISKKQVAEQVLNTYEI